ncbi:TPA: phage tail protein, partial [Streptococcus suis]|nr:phage tail protein [Streptococcus suis]HEM3972332.1 phage tail protein [Streptococcus suis]HEM3976442.1 phage tail protein [Streptococcus suis]HEM3984642.1 phage tail protein [Streptococcus suis]HEM3986700.1 phage tail protein [Streptococcus suis]
MICLYAAEESLFEHNGLGILDNDLKKCHVEELINNLYTLTAQYPLWAKFGKLIRNGMIIKAPTPNGDQLFRIYQSKPSMGMLEIHAFHIFYDLAFNFVEDTNIVSKSGQAWLQQLSQNTQYSHPFTFFSDISKVAGSRVVRKNCVEILLNTSLDNSFVNRFGGEILRDNFKVYFNRAIGENRGFKIRHKKNLKGYTANIDDKSVITRIMPIGFDGLLLPEKYVDSPRIRDYPFPRIGKVEVDVKAAVGENADAKDAVPLNEAYTKMRTLIKEQFGVIDVPTCSYEVDFVELSKTKEYADFQNLETVRIGDTVTVSHDEDGFYVEAKVIRYEYDSLAGSLLRIEAGQFESRSSNNSINQQRSIEQQLEDVKIETSNMVQVAANGKNTIYRGIDRPANANVGDLWYEPLENSVVLKQWSGVDWELIPISDQNLGNVNVNNLSGNHIDVRRFRISSGDRDILYVNEVGEVILNAKRVQIDFTDVATKDDLKKIELTPGPKGEKGEPGQRGADGLPGRDGVGIRSTTVTYVSSTNGTTAPTTGWTEAVPTVDPGNYLWTKTVWTYTDGNTETGYNVSRIGQDGNTGRDGIAGKDGVGIRTTTVVYAGSTSGTVPPTSGWSSQIPSVSPGQYLWTKTTWSYTDNTSETGFSVAKMGETGAKGDRGATGPQGPQGPAGPKGEP